MCIRDRPMAAHQVARLTPLIAPRKHVLFRDPAPGAHTRYGPNAAFISLSTALVCLMEFEDGTILTHQDVGKLGMSVHHVWNLVAQNVLRTQPSTDMVEFRVRNASFSIGDDCPRGYEVRAPAGHAAAWLAHPRTFALLHRHFSSVLPPVHELLYATRDNRELFVFDSTIEAVARVLPTATIIRHSLGFPLAIKLQRTTARSSYPGPRKSATR